MISLIAGVIFSTHAIGLIRPLDYAQGDQKSLDDITHYFTRLVLGVQLVLAGVQLPSKYLLREWKPLAWLLGPGMTGMWLCSSLLVWALVPNLSFVPALAVGACVTPTDPVLSNSIVKGRFADKNVPRDLQRVIIAESGANDGLGYPFLFLALYLLKYVSGGGSGSSNISDAVHGGGAGTAIGLWFGETWGYQILLGTAYGAVVGYLAKELLHWAEERGYVDRESFLVFAITLALFITGTCGMIGSDDVLACFVAGNAFTLDDWFRLETLDDSLQPTIDMLLNLSIFMWLGAVCPWASFARNDIIPLYRLIPLGILVLLLRRLPVVLLLRRRIPQIEHMRQALFVGFFGPIGVSAIFYLFVSLDFLQDMQNTSTGSMRQDAAQLQDTMRVVIWFLAVCSIVVHGLSVPLGKIGYYLPRTFSSARDSRDETGETISRSHGASELPFRLGERISFTSSSHAGIATGRRNFMSHKWSRGGGGNNNNGCNEPERQVFRVGGSVVPGKPEGELGEPPPPPLFLRNAPVITTVDLENAHAHAHAQAIQSEHHPSAAITTTPTPTTPCPTTPTTPTPTTPTTPTTTTSIPETEKQVTLTKSSSSSCSIPLQSIISKSSPVDVVVVGGGGNGDGGDGVGGGGSGDGSDSSPESSSPKSET